MANICQHLRSVKCNTFGKYLALISVIGMIFFPVLALKDVSIGFLVAIWISALLIVLFEFPILSKCFRADSTGEKIALSAQRPIIRALFYTGFSAIMWITVNEAATAIIAPAITLTLSVVALLISAFKCEETEINNSESRRNNIAATTILSSNAEAGKV